MKKNYSFIDLWDLEKNNIDKKKLPKSLIKGYELRKEQLKYKFNKTSNNNNILNKFRDFANQPSNIINPDNFIEKVKKNFEKEKKVNIIVKNIDDLNNKNLTLLKKRNNKLKELEVEIKNKKNIISNDEYIKELKIFEQKINDFNLEKNKIVKEFKDFREKELDNLFRLFSPIISNYMKENSINVLFDSKNILMGNVDSNKTNDILEIINNEIK